MAKNSTDSTQDEDVKDDLDQEVDDDSQDETSEDELDTKDESDEETDDESDDSDDEGEDESDDEDSEDFKKRFTQIKGDSPTEYLKNLETTYAEHSKEAVKLNRQNKELQKVVDRINQLVAANPELAKAFKGDEVKQEEVAAKDPAVAWAEAEMQRTWQKDYDEFVEQHPEIESDPALADELNEQLSVVRDVIQKKEGRLVGMGEGLRKAWKLLDKDDTQEKVRMAAKENASKGKSASGKKSDSKGKTKFTESQVETMMSLQSIDRTKAIKLLAEYNN